MKDIVDENRNTSYYEVSLRDGNGKEILFAITGIAKENKMRTRKNEKEDSPTVAGAGTPINGTEQVTSRSVFKTGEQVQLHHYKNPATGKYDHFATTRVRAYCNHFCYGSYGSYVVYTEAIG